MNNSHELAIKYATMPETRLSSNYSHIFIAVALLLSSFLTLYLWKPKFVLNKKTEKLDMMKYVLYSILTAAAFIGIMMIIVVI